MLREYLKSIADKFRLALGTTNQINAQEFPDKVIEVYSSGYDTGLNFGYENGVEQGKQAEYDKFWDAYQENGNKKTYGYCFAGTSWNSENFKPKYPLVLNHTASNTSVCMFSYFDRNLKKPPLEIREGDIDFSGKMYSMSSMFSNANITVVEMNAVPSILNSMNDTFSMTDIGKHKLHTIKIGTREETTYSGNTFRCGGLQNVSFVEDSVIGTNISFSYPKQLTKTSIENIINTLSSTVTDKTLTLNKIAIQNAFGTDYDSSTEWTTLKNSKSNWTITLS